MTAISNLTASRGPYEKDVVVIAASAVAVSCAADTAENVLATITIPAGIMGLNGRLRITTNWSYTNSANAKTARTRFSGVAGTAYQSSAITTQANSEHVTHIQNRGAPNSQYGYSQGIANTTGVFATAQQSGAVDTTVATTVVISGQKASAGETMTLESYLVELVYV